MSYLQNPYILYPLLLLLTTLALAVGLYFSPYADDVGEYVAKRYFKGKAEAQKKLLQHTGEEKARAFLSVYAFFFCLLFLSSPASRRLAWSGEWSEE